jgi:hypothetical protein
MIFFDKKQPLIQLFSQIIIGTIPTISSEIKEETIRKDQ